MSGRFHVKHQEGKNMPYAILVDKMIEYYRGDTKRIQHFLKVYAYASTIGESEEVDSETLHILRTAAIVHDIGIKSCEQKYGSCSGDLQEKEGPSIAQQMLTSLHFDDKTIRRVCWLVGHHHTYHDIVDKDHQILVESDFLVNMCEDQMSPSQVISVFHKIFRTESGKKICSNLFGLKTEDTSIL